MDKLVFRDLWNELDLPKLSLSERQIRLENLLIPLVGPGVRYRTIPLPFKPWTQNYEIVIPGTDPRLLPLVFCSHHDCIGPGAGVVDNWTGVVGVLDLVQEALAKPFHHTVVCCWFAEEELGQRGSEYYVQKFLMRNPGIVVNLECLGCQPLAYAKQNHPALVPTGACPSYYAGMPSDSDAFIRHGVPTVTLDGLSTQDRGFRPPLHTRFDNRDALNKKLLHKTYSEIEQYARDLDTLD